MWRLAPRQAQHRHARTQLRLASGPSALSARLGLSATMPRRAWSAQTASSRMPTALHASTARSTTLVLMASVPNVPTVPGSSTANVTIRRTRASFLLAASSRAAMTTACLGRMTHRASCVRSVQRGGSAQAAFVRPARLGRCRIIRTGSNLRRGIATRSCGLPCSRLVLSAWTARSICTARTARNASGAVLEKS